MTPLYHLYVCFKLAVNLYKKYVKLNGSISQTDNYTHVAVVMLRGMRVGMVSMLP